MYKRQDRDNVLLRVQKRAKYNLSQIQMEQGRYKSKLNPYDGDFDYLSKEEDVNKRFETAKIQMTHANKMTTDPKEKFTRKDFLDLEKDRRKALQNIEKFKETSSFLSTKRYGNKVAAWTDAWIAELKDFME